MTRSCSYNRCGNTGKFRCCKCKISHYCCQEHQRLHWADHKKVCNVNSSEQSDNDTHSNRVSSNTCNDTARNLDSDPKKCCRCMFCGEELIIASEDEAVAHMGICPALQEQLNSSDQFTIPSVIREKSFNPK